MSQVINKGDRVRVTVEGEWAGWDGITPSGAFALLRAEKMEILPDDTVTVEKLDPEPKFKVGDRVRVSHNPRGLRKFVAGHTGTVTQPILPSGCGFWVSISGARGYFPANELEFAADQTFKLKWGDRIRNNKTGRVGVVAVGADGHLWVVDPETCDEETGATAAAVEEYEDHRPGTYEIISRAGGPF